MRDAVVVTPTSIEVTLDSDALAVTELIDALRAFQTIARESWGRVVTRDFPRPRLAVTAVTMESPFRAKMSWVVPAAAGTVILGYSAGFFGQAGADSYRYLQARFAEAPTVTEDAELRQSVYPAQFLERPIDLESRIADLVDYLAKRGIAIQVRIIDDDSDNSSVADNEG